MSVRKQNTAITENLTKRDVCYITDIISANTA